MPNTGAAAAMPPAGLRFLVLASHAIKKPVEHFGCPDRVLQASLTELETTGMLAVSAQSIATGKSLNLAPQDCAKAAETGARIISRNDPEDPARTEGDLNPPGSGGTRAAAFDWPSPALRW
jgi:predicted Rossmann fold nucleotide-binding protein DprA/Smf involved in DNA uptake